MVSEILCTVSVTFSKVCVCFKTFYLYFKVLIWYLSDIYHKQDDEQAINRHETLGKIYVKVEEL